MPFESEIVGPLLVRGDFLAARSASQETILVPPGGSIYLNRDAWWNGCRTIDCGIERALRTAVGRWLTK